MRTWRSARLTNLSTPTENTSKYQPSLSRLGINNLYVQSPVRKPTGVPDMAKITSWWLISIHPLIPGKLNSNTLFVHYSPNLSQHKSRACHKKTHWHKIWPRLKSLYINFLCIEVYPPPCGLMAILAEPDSDMPGGGWLLLYRKSLKISKAVCLHEWLSILGLEYFELLQQCLDCFKSYSV